LKALVQGRFSPGWISAQWNRKISLQCDLHYKHEILPAEKGDQDATSLNHGPLALPDPLLATLVNIFSLKIPATTHIRLPLFHSTPLPFEVAVVYPSKITIGSTFELLVSIRNATTRKPHVLNFSVEQSANYLISGTVRGQILLLPSELQTLVFKVLPLECGFMRVPLVNVRYSHSKASLLRSGDFGSIFVEPLQL
jgi:hypothetical protein